MGTDETQTSHVQRSATDSSNETLVDCVKYVAALFGITAVAIAVFVLLLDVVDQDTLGLAIDQEAMMEEMMAGDMSEDDITVGDELAASILPVVGVVGIVASAFVGAFLSRVLRDDDGTVLKAAAASAFAGMLVLWVLSGILGGVFTELSEEIGDLVINGILAGIGAAVAAAGAAWATRNVAPTGIDRERGTDAAGAVPGDD